MAPAQKDKKAKKAMKKAVTREHTIHLHRRLHGITRKKRAPRAIKEVRKFAEQQLGTPEVRISTELNKYLWSQGVKSVPFRVRVRLDRRRDEDDDSGKKFYTIVSHVPGVTSFKKLTNITVETEE